ncbi:MAG: hypothetical protein ACO3T6_01715 [Candidatus Nanopelagicaceae bacterium]|jgi:hypothetical protein
MMRSMISLLFGAGVAVSGVFLHNSYRPFGLIFSLFALTVGAYLVREMYRSRLSSWLFLIGWVLVIIRASTIGNGGEILIEANLFGNLLVLGGAALLILFTLRSRKIS